MAIVQVGGCVSFRRFEIAQNGSTVQVAALGHDAGGRGVNCPADIRDESKAMRIYGTFADSIVLSSRQPDGAMYPRRVIRVRTDVVCLTSFVTRPAALTLSAGDTARVSAQACNASASDFRWGATPGGVVTVTEDGLVTALKAGSAVVIGRLKSDTMVFGAIAATVVP